MILQCSVPETDSLTRPGPDLHDSSHRDSRIDSKERYQSLGSSAVRLRDHEVTGFFQAVGIVVICFLLQQCTMRARDHTLQSGQYYGAVSPWPTHTTDSRGQTYTLDPGAERYH